MELNYNSYKIYGAGHNVVNSCNFIESFAMFPDENTIVRLNFFDNNPSLINGKSSDAYLNRRNSFLGGYTAHLNQRKK